MTYLSQTLGLSVHQFISGALGLAVLVAVGRALARASVKSIGNFWVDLTRCTLYIVIPLSVLWAIPLVWQGVPQTWKAYPTASLVEPYTAQVQKTDDKGNPVTASVAKVDDKGKPVLGADGKPRDGRPARHGGPEGGDAAPSGRPGGLVRVLQAALHERRRLVRRKQRPSLREPDAALGLPRDARDHRGADGPGLHVRPADRQQAPRVDPVCRHARALRALVRGGLALRGQAEPRR